MKKLIGCFALIMLFLSSCGSVKMSDSRVAYINNDIRSYSLVDLEVSPTRVTGICADQKLHPEARKVQAIANAVKAANADLLIDPLFTYEGQGVKMVITVTGYAAKYKNFRSTTAK